MEAVLDSTVRHSLRLGSVWKVDRMVLDAKAQRIDIYVSHAGQGLTCPKTGETGTLYDHRKARAWRRLDWFQFRCFVHCRVPRVKPSAGVNAIQVPWSSASQRHAEAFESWTIRWLKATRNQTKTAELLRCKFDVVNRILHRSVARGDRRRTLEDVSHLRVDEKAIQRGHKYATVVSDSRRGLVLDVGQGRDKQSAKALLQGLLGRIRGAIRTVATDMWKACVACVKDQAVREVVQIAQMFERHQKGVCNALCHEQSNARAERINGKIREIKTVGRGYRKIENFRGAILFFHGDLDLYPQYSR